MKMKILGEDIEIPIEGKEKQRQPRHDSGNGMGGLLRGIVFALLIIMIFMYPMFVASIGAGERGVKFNRLAGGVEEDELSEGWHIKAPWVSVTNYNIKTQDYTMSVIADEGEVQGDDRISAISKDGLKVDFDITILYHPIPDMVSDIHQNVGPRYENIIIRPVTRTTIRDVAGEYDAMEMHQKRAEIGERILSKLGPNLAGKNIVLEQVLVRSIIRPPQIDRAIEEKLQAEQEAQKMEFVIQKESSEAERKGIEAAGIAKANNIIGESLTSSYLSWYWITNLDKHNSVIYVPITDQGFPMFKNIDEIPKKP